MIAFTLCVLALFDSAFTGFRSHAGREGQIQKRTTAVQASLRGALCGLGVLLLLAVVYSAVLALTHVAYSDFVAAGKRMSIVYMGFVIIITAGFGAYFSPSIEVRSAATLLILGPGTFIRPFVIMAGVVAASAGAPPVVGGCAALAGALILALAYPLNTWHKRRTSPFG